MEQINSRHGNKSRLYLSAKRKKQKGFGIKAKKSKEMPRNYVDWSNAQCLALIEEYRKQPILWESVHPAHYDIPKKRMVWQEICDNLQSDLGQVKQKITSLLGSFRRERAKERKTATTDAPYKSKWYAFQPMQFLSCNDVPDQENTDYETVTPDEINIEEKSMHDLLFETNYFPNESSNDPLNSNAPQTKLEETLLAPQKQTTKRTIAETSTSNAPKKTYKKRKQKIQIENVHTVQPSISKTEFRNEEVLANLKEECSTFGQHIANKLLKYNSRTRAMVEHAINNIIFEADIGNYEQQFVDSPTTVTTSYQHIEPDTNCSTSSKSVTQMMDFIKVESTNVE